jgi:hypothetical protein
MYVNRVYHFYHKAIDDLNIGIEEMGEFTKIIHEYESVINTVNSKHNSSNIQMERIKHKAFKEAEAECETEILSKPKGEAKNEIKSELLFQGKN